MNYNNFWDEIHGSPIKGCIYYFKIAIALAVAAIPEGLPAVITTCLALGTRKMAANNAIVRRLNSVETLGCTTIICSDKTGTLTKNEMCAVKMAYIGTGVNDIRTHNVTERSYDPNAPIEGLDENKYLSYPVIGDMATVCALNNKATIKFEEGKYTRMGDPTEAALKVVAEKIGKFDSRSKNADLKKNPESFTDACSATIRPVAVLDFSSKRKTMSTIVTGYKGNKGNTVLLKGAPERVLDRCISYKTADGAVKTLTASDKQALLATIAGYAAEGLRVLGIAITEDGGKLKDVTAANASKHLGNPNDFEKLEEGSTFLGVMCIKDPVRKEVKSAIQDCKTAGIRVIMITGDSKETAIAIAKELEIIDPKNTKTGVAITGSEFIDLNTD